MSELIELAARVEAATGADRSLDALIHCVREDLEFVLFSTGNEAYGDICDPGDSGHGTKNRCSPGMLYARYSDHKNPPTLGGGKRGNSVQGCTPDHYTASLDAAMSLVPEGHVWDAGTSRFTDSPAFANVGRRDQDSDYDSEAFAATPALALTAAALKARAGVKS